MVSWKMKTNEEKSNEMKMKKMTEVKQWNDMKCEMKWARKKWWRKWNEMKKKTIENDGSNENGNVKRKSKNEMKENKETNVKYEWWISGEEEYNEIMKNEKWKKWKY